MKIPFPLLCLRVAAPVLSLLLLSGGCGGGGGGSSSSPSSPTQVFVPPFQGPPPASTDTSHFTALYGSDGNDFYRFTGTSSISNLKNAGWNGLLLFTLSVHDNGDIFYGNATIASNGQYVGDSRFGSNINALKSPPTGVRRFEVSLSGANDPTFTNIQNLINSQGTGSDSILYRNFQALKEAAPGIDAVSFDDEETYDVASATSFGRILNTLGYKVSLAPYANIGFWAQLKRNLGSGCDLVYLQCYAGGLGNEPKDWNNAFGDGFHCLPGIESNDASSTPFSNWAANSGTTGGFYWPDIQWSPSSSWGPQDILDGVGGNTIIGRTAPSRRRQKPRK